MPYGFEIINGILDQYDGDSPHVVIPGNVTEIESMAFIGCESVRSVVIPNSVKKIGIHAFEGCTNLTSVTLPDSVTCIDSRAFYGCRNLSSFSLPDSVTEVGSRVFHGCRKLADRNGFVILRRELFDYCGSASCAAIPDNVTVIEACAFCDCDSLTSVSIPDSVTKIKESAFRGCKNLISLTIPDGVTEIGYYAFFCCSSLTTVMIPGSVTEISPTAFDSCPNVTIICGEGSYAQKYCSENHLSFIFDYQFEAFGGLLPQGFEKLASPFLADEEKPYTFISYSHKDRDTVLPIIKTLYESGWKIWYDEGLTIGDKYDETLEAHVEHCSAFLLFISENSIRSFYCLENEIPWAIGYGKPIIKCILDEGTDYEIREGSVAATVSSPDIEPALEHISGLVKGKPRVAKGISVVVNPADRDGADGNGFAYCLYSESGAKAAKAILLEARNSGCAIYDAVENGADEKKLRDSACLIVCLDRAFLSDESLTKILMEEYLRGRDLAVCQLENIEDEDLPPELVELHLMQWLNFVYGINMDMTTKLSRHLQKRGCRNAAILPGFDYEKDDRGIVIRRYTGLDPEPWMEAEYGGVPVVEIADNAFKNCIHLTAFVIPDGITRIGANAFDGCLGLTSITIPGSVKEIGEKAFQKCTGLTSAAILEGVTKIGKGAFYSCPALTSAAIPDSVTEMGKEAFWLCKSLASVTLSKSLTSIEDFTFADCESLTSITIPDGVTKIGGYAFAGCANLASVVIPDSVTKIGDKAFGGCKKLADSDGLIIIKNTLLDYCGNASSVTVPDGVTRIGVFAFNDNKTLTSIVVPDSVTELGYQAIPSREGLVVTCTPDTPTARFCSYNHVPHREPKAENSLLSGLKRVGKLFGRK